VYILYYRNILPLSRVYIGESWVFAILFARDFFLGYIFGISIQARIFDFTPSLGCMCDLSHRTGGVKAPSEN
jgi:hypothetical protein